MRQACAPCAGDRCECRPWVGCRRPACDNEGPLTRTVCSKAVGPLPARSRQKLSGNGAPTPVVAVQWDCSPEMVYRGGCVAEYVERSPSTCDGQIGVTVTSSSEEGAMAMTYFVGLDVSVKETAVCVVDDTGKVVCERKVPTEPDDIVALLTSIGGDYGRVGIEAGPLSQWLVNGLTAAGLPVVCVESRHMMALLKAQQVNKSDRNDARGIAQMMRVGLFKPVHVKTQLAQEQRMLLSSRKLVQRKLLDVESDLRGTLRNFGLKVGTVSADKFEARIRELVTGFPRLALIVEPLLAVRLAMRQQFAVLH